MKLSLFNIFVVLFSFWNETFPYTIHEPPCREFLLVQFYLSCGLLFLAVVQLLNRPNFDAAGVAMMFAAGFLWPLCLAYNICALAFSCYYYRAIFSRLRCITGVIRAGTIQTTQRPR